MPIPPRDWIHSSTFTHIRQDMARLCTATAWQIVHACVGCAQFDFISASSHVLPPPPANKPIGLCCAQLESERLIPRLLHGRCPDFSYQRTRFDQDTSKAGTGRRAVGALLAPRVSCYTLEVSFYAAKEGSGPASKATHKVYTQEACAFRPCARAMRPRLLLCVRGVACFDLCCFCTTDLRLGRDFALMFLDYHTARAADTASSVRPNAGVPPKESSRSWRAAASGSSEAGFRVLGSVSSSLSGTSRLTATPIVTRPSPATKQSTSFRARSFK